MAYDESSSGIFIRESRWPPTYFTILGVVTAANAGLFVMDTIVWYGSVGAMVWYYSFVEYFGGAASFSILKAALATEGWRLVMLLSERIRKRLIHQGYQEGHEKGRIEERQKYVREIAAWYERQQKAIERGEDFDEPPPGLKG